MPDFTPRPTVYKGIKMRSRLEAGFAGWLDRTGIKWEYEPHAIATEQGQYLPDFLVREGFMYPPPDPYPLDLYIEVRPSLQAVMDTAERLQRAAFAITRTPLSGEQTMFAACTPQGSFAIVPTNDERRIVPMRCRWLLAGEQGAEHAILALGPMEDPFEKEWWH